MFTRDSKLSELVTGVKGLGFVDLCREQTETEAFLAKNPDITIGEFMDGEMLKIFDEPQYLGWLIEMGDKCSSDIRRFLISKIKNEMAALQTYLALPNMTKKEGKLLKKKFEGLLPTAEKELKEGKVKRVK